MTRGILPLTPYIKQRRILYMTPYIKQRGILYMTPYIKQRRILPLTPYVKKRRNAMKCNLQKIQTKDKKTPQMTNRETPYTKKSTNGVSKGGTPFLMMTTMTWTSTIKSSGGMCLADKVVQAKIIDILISLFFI
jgi:hypothetical protein